MFYCIFFKDLYVLPGFCCWKKVKLKVQLIVWHTLKSRLFFSFDYTYWNYTYLHILNVRYQTKYWLSVMECNIGHIYSSTVCCSEEAQMRQPTLLYFILPPLHTLNANYYLFDNLSCKLICRFCAASHLKCAFKWIYFNKNQIKIKRMIQKITIKEMLNISSSNW